MADVATSSILVESFIFVHHKYHEADDNDGTTLRMPTLNISNTHTYAAHMHYFHRCMTHAHRNYFGPCVTQHRYTYANDTFIHA